MASARRGLLTRVYPGVTQMATSVAPGLRDTRSRAGDNSSGLN